MIFFQEEDTLQWRQNILVDDDRKFLYCVVPKTESTDMKRALIETSSRISREVITNRTQKMISKLYVKQVTGFIQNWSLCLSC